MSSTLPAAVHRAIVCVDVENFGDNSRTNRDQIGVRANLYKALRGAFARSGVRWENCYHEDRGDGALILVPADVPKERLVASWPLKLASNLERHNHVSGHRTRIRLRVAIHAGEVHHDSHGVTGTAINMAFRLLQARALKTALRDSPGVLALIASAWFYDEVIRHNPHSNPHEYQRVRVAVKEVRTSAWIHLPAPQFASVLSR
jgi:class 3 adenylate cyclase